MLLLDPDICYYHTPTAASTSRTDESAVRGANAVFIDFLGFLDTMEREQCGLIRTGLPKSLKGFGNPAEMMESAGVKLFDSVGVLLMSG